MCKNLIKLLDSIGKDKWLHFLACLLIEQFLFAVAHAFGCGNWFVIPAFVVAFGAGILKERHDSKAGGVFDHYDIVFDFLGCFVATVFISLMLI